MQGSCVPDFQHQALASQDGQNVASQDEAFTHELLLLTEKKTTGKMLWKKFNWAHETFSLLHCPSPREGFCRSTTSLGCLCEYILPYYPVSPCILPVIDTPTPSWISLCFGSMHTVINTSNNFSSRLFIQDYMGKVLPPKFFKLCFLFWPNSPPPRSNHFTTHFEVSRSMELFPELFLFQVSECSYVQLFGS